MTRPLNFILLTFSLLTGLSCRQIDPVTRQLKEYLQGRFNMDLPRERSYFVLIPSNQCPNCINFRADLLPPAVNGKTKILSGFDASHFRDFKNYYFDTANYLIRLPIVDYSNKIFVVENETVTQVLPLTNIYDQLRSLEYKKND